MTDVSALVASFAVKALRGAPHDVQSVKREIRSLARGQPNAPSEAVATLYELRHAFARLQLRGPGSRDIALEIERNIRLAETRRRKIAS